MCEMLGDLLGSQGYAVTARTRAEEALALLDTSHFDLVVTDMRLGSMSGLDLCRRATETRPTLPVVVFTGFGDMNSVIDALRAGATDFVPKPGNPKELEQALGHAVRRALEHRRLGEEVTRLRTEVEKYHPVDELIGDSAAVRTVRDMITRLADTDAPVLITGETGTGKELVARALHARSRRGGGPFVAINCAAVPDTLLEAELFGHARGAFTDAKAQRKGLLVEASGGTLLLDEIAELPVVMQPKLLRALQERKVRPLGSPDEMPFDCRIMAATNRDLESEVEARRFRKDLYFRLDVLQIHLPPLRARGQDVLLLAQFFIDRLRKRTGKLVHSLTEPAARRLLDYDWPGNVRELENTIERAVALCRGEEIDVSDLPERVAEASPRKAIANDVGELCSLEELERRHIERVLDAVGGNKREAARVLQLDRSTLYRKLKRYRLVEEEV